MESSNLKECEFQQKLTGQYNKTNKIVQGRPVYQHWSGSRYLYSYSKTRWVIGPEIASSPRWMSLKFIGNS